MSTDQGSSCDPAAPCTFQWVDVFGFVSIPFMAGCGFIAVTGLAILSLRPTSPGRLPRKVVGRVGGDNPAQFQQFTQLLAVAVFVVVAVPVSRVLSYPSS